MGTAGQSNWGGGPSRERAVIFCTLASAKRLCPEMVLQFMNRSSPPKVPTVSAMYRIAPLRPKGKARPTDGKSKRLSLFRQPI